VGREWGREEGGKLEGSVLRVGKVGWEGVKGGAGGGGREWSAFRKGGGIEWARGA